MGRPHYFPLYVADFSNDHIVEAMTTEQVGAYTLLLCKAWMQEPGGSLPDNDEVLARWSRVSLDRWMKIKLGVLIAFKKQGDRWVQKRMTAEYAKAIAKSRSRARAGAVGGIMRAHQRSNCQANATSLPKQSDSDSNSESGFRGGGAGGGGPSDVTARFAEFWEAYPRRQANAAALKAWLNLAPDETLTAAVLAGLQAARQSRQWLDGVIPHPATWLNGRRWEDDHREETNGHIGGRSVGSDSRIGAATSPFAGVGERIVSSVAPPAGTSTEPTSDHAGQDSQRGGN